MSDPQYPERKLIDLPDVPQTGHIPPKKAQERKGYVAPAMKRRYAKEAREAKMKRRAIKMRKGVGKKRNPPRKKPLRWATAEWRVYKYRVLGARGAVYETTTLKEAKKMAGKNGQIIEYFKPK